MCRKQEDGMTTKNHSHAMRSKEDAQDYRYFPEPDLVPIVISDEWIQKVTRPAAGTSF